MKIKTETLLIVLLVALGLFLVMSQSKAKAPRSSTGFSLGFNEDGSVSEASLGLGFLDEIFAGWGGSQTA